MSDVKVKATAVTTPAASPAAGAQKFVIPAEWKERCDLIRLNGPTRSEFIPLYNDFLKVFMTLEQLDYSLFFASGWDMYEVVKPKDFSATAVKEILTFHKQFPSSTRICIRKTDAARFERTMNDCRRKKFQDAAAGGALANEAAYKIYAELSTTVQMVFRGMIDADTYNSVARAASSAIVHMCSTRDMMRFLTEVVGKEAALYDHGAITSFVSGAIAWNVLKLPKRESKLIVQSGLIHDIERHCAYLGKAADINQISQGAIKEISGLVQSKTAFHESHIIVLEQYRERYTGGGYPKGLAGQLETDPRGISRLARVVAIGCGFSEFMLKRKDKLPLDLPTIQSLMQERVKRGEFDPEMVQGLFADVKSGQIRRMTAEQLKDDDDDLDE